MRFFRAKYESCVVLAESAPERLRTFIQERRWNLRLLSSASTNYNKDYHGITDKGYEDTMLNVFKKEGNIIRHFWGNEIRDAPMDKGQDHRAVDMLNPIFNMFDITPEGRGDFYTKIYY